MTFRVFPKPRQTSEDDSRAPVFGKRPPYEPPEPAPTPRRMMEAVAFGFGAAILAYLVVDVL